MNRIGVRSCVADALADGAAGELAAHAAVHSSHSGPCVLTRSSPYDMRPLRARQRDERPVASALLGGPAAVYRQYDARHQAARWRREVDDRRGNVVDRSHPTGGNTVHDTLEGKRLIEALFGSLGGA